MTVTLESSPDITTNQPLVIKEFVLIGGLSLLRVVRCLPSTPGLSVLDKTLRAGVGQASREETAGCFEANQDRRLAMGI